jgi:hypothetical protein
MFYLGTHKPHWLWHPAARFPMMVSHRTLQRYKVLHESTDPWILDSGGFSELSMYGRWCTTVREYVTAVARYQREIGNLVWAAPMDWMCEPEIIHGGRIGTVNCPGTGLSEAEHQNRTTASLFELRERWPEYSDAPDPFIPVIQGSSVTSRIRHISACHQAGIRFTSERQTGIGSVCRLQSTSELHDLVRAMRLAPRLHLFGVKTTGLTTAGYLAESSDSAAWSADARYSPPFPGHPHQACNNCLPYAAAWRRRLLATLAAGDGGYEAGKFPHWEPGPSQVVSVRCWDATAGPELQAAA